MILLFFIYFTFFMYGSASVANKNEVCIVVLSQLTDYHEKLFQKKKTDIEKQSINNPQLQIKVFSSHSLAENEIGHWTIFPLLVKLSHRKQCEWILFLEELTSFNLNKIIDVFQKYNSSEEIFAGYALHDKEPSIIHHFADPASLLYPHFSAGFILSWKLVQRLAAKLHLDDEYSFSIDPKYEFAKFIWDSGNGVTLQHENQLCITKDENCATWVEEEFPNCGSPIPAKDIYVAVKTCHKFHQNRIKILKETWGPEVKNLNVFSDKEEESIPTIKLDVENVAHGHCEKTLSILQYYVNNNISLQWLVIVDDDTIMSFHRLKKLLSCYNATIPVLIGERYGYGVAQGVGYDYITGGGGMLFSLPALKLLATECQCPSVDSPDDMILGLCSKRLGIPIIHSPYFHQARPVDYSPEFLKPFTHVSFHKHWMINPYLVYNSWLNDDYENDRHIEL